MDEAKYLQRMREAIENPRLTCLFLEAQMKPSQDRHFNEAFKGFEILKDYLSTGNTALLEQARRSFDYVTNQDLKYVRTLSYLGKAIVAGFYQDGRWFRYAYSNLDQIINMTLWNADYQSFIEELQTECRHLKEDMKSRDSELFPLGAMFRNWF